MYTIVNDIIGDKNVITIDLEVWEKDKFITSYDIDINLTKIGLNYKMDYGFQLSKDLEHIFQKLYIEKNRLPIASEIRDKLLDYNYIIIKTKK